jgi:hypothetical protein
VGNIALTKALLTLSEVLGHLDLPKLTGASEGRAHGVSVWGVQRPGVRSYDGSPWLVQPCRGVCRSRSA